MIRVNFSDKIDDSVLKFAVIISKTEGKWVFCKHKERDTYEVPGGHREENESIMETAERELREETGALNFNMVPVCVYSVEETDGENKETFGMLFCAEIFSFEEINSEIENIVVTNELIENWTYPFIQPKLIEEAQRRGFC